MGQSLKTIFENVIDHDHLNAIFGNLSLQILKILTSTIAIRVFVSGEDCDLGKGIKEG